MQISIASWNINSVRLRLSLLLDFLTKFNIDILCLQETKCPDSEFPLQSLHDCGYNHTIFLGQKSYNGVAIISRLPLREPQKIALCAKNDCRHISAIFKFVDKDILLHNFYVPAGGDIPDVNLNEKFAHKLEFVKQMCEFNSRQNGTSSILVGDLNIAPSPYDVWSHKQLLNVVSHTPVETDLLQACLKSGQWVDFVRYHLPEPQKIYSWWSYRARDWRASNRGRRLDHIWGAEDLLPYVKEIKIIEDMRGAKQPSDHVPIIAYLDDGNK